MIPASKSRLIAVSVITAALLAILGLRLWYLQIQTHQTYVALASQDRVRYVIEPPVRGQILDDTGRAIVNNAASLTVSVDMAQVGQQADGGKAELGRLARLLGLTDKTVQERVRLCTVGVSQPCWQGSPYQPIPVADHISQRIALQVLEDKKLLTTRSRSAPPSPRCWATCSRSRRKSCSG